MVTSQRLFSALLVDELMNFSHDDPFAACTMPQVDLSVTLDSFGNSKKVLGSLIVCPEIVLGIT
jgi:hypothetical protein